MIVIIAKRERAPQKKETPTSIMLDVRIKMLSRNKKKKGIVSRTYTFMLCIRSWWRLAAAF